MTYYMNRVLSLLLFYEIRTFRRMFFIKYVFQFNRHFNEIHNDNIIYQPIHKIYLVVEFKRHFVNR